MKCKYCYTFEKECAENEVHPENPACPAFTPSEESGLTVTDNGLILPLNIKEAIDKWVEDGVYPDNFLTAVIENNLSECINKTDEINIVYIRDIVRYLYNNCPNGCWGSKKKVEMWLEKKKQERMGG